MKRRTLLSLFLLVLLLVLEMCWPRERLLLDQATYVATMEDWDEYRDHKHAAFGHNWLSDQEVLFARKDEDAQGKEEYHYFICDTRSGSTTPAAKYEKALNMAEADNGVQFSPDRQWFYAQHWCGHGLDVVKCDGSRKYAFKEKSYPLLWLSDSLYINAIDAEDYTKEWKTEKDCLRLCSVADSRILKELSQPNKYFFDAGHLVYCADHFVGLSTTSDQATHKVSVEVTKTGLGLKDYLTRKQVFTLSLPYPQNIRNVEARLSPDGTRIVYQCVMESVSPLLAWLHYLYPHFDPKPQRRVALWVSEVDGKHLHEVGHINLGEEKAEENYTDAYLDFEWLPSGRRLAFRYKERLYTVAAD